MFFFAGGALGLIAIGVWLFALIDAALSPPAGVRYLQKVLWVVIVLLLLDIGAVLWFLFGRPRVGAPGQRAVEPDGSTAGPWGRGGLGGVSPGAGVPRPGSVPGRRPAGRPRPVAPDDDPDFLRSLDDRHRDDRPGPDTDGAAPA